MTSSSPASRLLRLSATILVTATALSLTGCALFPGNQDPAASSSSRETPAPPDNEPVEVASAEPVGGSTLAFAEGADLPSTATVQWGDGLFTDESWAIVSPDNGSGGWKYGTVDGTCTAQFWQGSIPDVPVVAGDDSVSSDAMLGILLTRPTAEVTPVATTDEFSYQIGGNGGVENRQVIGGEGDRSWLMAARAFTQIGAGMYVIVDCTGADATATMARINEENSIIVTP